MQTNVSFFSMPLFPVILNGWNGKENEFFLLLEKSHKTQAPYLEAIIYSSVSQPPGRVPVPGLGDLFTWNTFENSIATNFTIKRPKFLISFSRKSISTKIHAKSASI